MHDFRVWAILIATAVLLAADPDWKTNLPPNGRQADAKQLLTASPWSSEPRRLERPLHHAGVSGFR